MRITWRSGLSIALLRRHCSADRRRVRRYRRRGLIRRRMSVGRRTGHRAGAAADAVLAAFAKPSGGPLAEVTLADIGFVNGLRFANLGGHHELFVPLPQRGDVDGERSRAGARRS